MDTSILDCQDGGDNPPLPETRAVCRERIIMLQSEIAAIRDQIAAADLDRQARGGRMDARWYHRARTALRFKREEMARLQDHLHHLPGGARERKARLKDAIIETVRADYGDDDWQQVLDEAHRILNSPESGVFSPEQGPAGVCRTSGLQTRDSRLPREDG